MATADAQTALYEKDTGNRAFRYVQLQVERDTGWICLSLVWNADTVKGFQTQLSRLVKVSGVRRLSGSLGRIGGRIFGEEYGYI